MKTPPIVSISSLSAALFDLDFTFLVFLISHGNPKMVIVVIDYYLRFDVAVYRI